MKRTLPLLTILLVGCAGRPYENPDKTQQEFYADRAACSQTASVLLAGTTYIDSRTFNDCMVGKGWTPHRRHLFGFR